MIPEFFQSIAGSIARWALTGAAGWLVQKGLIEPENTEALIAGAGAALAALAWSLYQKYQDRLKFKVALSMPPASREEDVKAEVKTRDVSVW